MARAGENALLVLKPNLQVSFYYALKALREIYFSEALSDTVRELDIETIDDELKRYVDKPSLSRVAAFGLRGEIIFPIPYILTARPTLLGYYRLLYGLSQKEFYNKGPFGSFKILETDGKVPTRLHARITALCLSLIGTGQQLVNGIDEVSLGIVHELQLLTLGPQLRGSQNTKVGQDATSEVFELIRSMVKPYIDQSADQMISLENDSHRTVLIEFASDPDICITELFESGRKPQVAVEIKGGTDASNIHNRLGEAEKSHQKAKGRGFLEFWTIIRVEVDEKLARKESPTTNRLFHLDRIKLPASAEHRVFTDMLASRLGIQIRA